MKKLTTISLFIFFVVVTAILTAGLVFYQNNTNSSSGLINQNTNTDIAKLASSGVTTLDLSEIAKHDTSTDCWILISGKVYNITSYFGKHPGGSSTMIATCGKDATAAYKTKDPYAATSGSRTAHSAGAVSLLDQYFVGNLNQKISPTSSNSNQKNNTSNQLTPNVNLNTNTNTQTSNQIISVTTALTSVEVAKHNTNSDCWIIVSSKVYNISNYASSHPGGTRNITNYCGKESTNAFDTKGGNGNPHSTSANNMLNQYFVGNLNQNISQSEIDANLQKRQLNPIGTNRENEYEDG